MRKSDGLRAVEGFVNLSVRLAQSRSFHVPETSMAEDDDWLHNEPRELLVQESLGLRASVDFLSAASSVYWADSLPKSSSREFFTFILAIWLSDAPCALAQQDELRSLGPMTRFERPKGVHQRHPVTELLFP